ncbi:MAG: hypothetical protein AAGD00_03420 [Planctomycetota bacterium]
MDATHAVMGIAALSIISGTASGQLVRSGSSADAAGLQGIVDTFRNDLGDLNAPEPGTVGSGRRQIDWDAAPDAVSSPNDFPGDFFNANVFPRARGVEFTTPGTGFRLSATEASGEGVRFSDIDITYETTFSAFSEERLFTPIGSTITDVNFFIPGTDVPATTTGFGAVFTDVDLAGSSSIEFFDALGDSLGAFDVEAGPTADGSLSFLGVSFEKAIIGSVRITSGDQALGGPESGYADLVALDDFIFGEPVPTPGSIALLAVTAIAGTRRKR